MAAASPLDWNALDFFKEEINKDNTAEIRIQAVKRLHLIASALGPSKVFEELIPYLNKEIGLEGAKDNPLANDDEFLFQMATQYAVLREYIKEEKLLCLVPPLVHLAQQEETVIRDEAIKSLCKICEEKPNLFRAQVLEELKSMVTKAEFTTRVSATALFATVYKIHSKAAAAAGAGRDAEEAFRTVRAGLCQSYKDICLDDTPMVRRASANKLHDFVKELELEDLTGAVFLEAYKNLAKEETQDSIRVNIVNTTIEMARKIKEGDPTNGKATNNEHTVPVIKECSSDRSWRVRLTVAKNFDKILLNFGHELTVEHLISLFYKLLQDPEQEVRKEAVKIIEPCLKITWDGNQQFDKLDNGSILQEIVKHMGSEGALLTDSAQPVRAALAQVMGPVAEKAGKDMTSRKLLPAISELMKDEFHDVRLNIVSHAGTFCDVLGVESFLHSCLHTIQTLIMDNHWRIRRSVVEQVPKLAIKFGVDMYQQKLEALFISSLRDSVFSVRKEALAQLKQIADHFGQQWTAEHLLSKIMDLYGGAQGQNPATGYASRVTTLQAMPKVWESLCADQSASSAVISLLIKALKDSVPNVRFCACKVVIELLTDSKDKTEIVKKIKPALLELGDGPSPDSDGDVQYFAQQGLKLCD